MSDENDNRGPFLKNPEKRHYQRIEMELPVEILVNGEKISATTENVSCGGMYLPLKTNDIHEEQNVMTVVNLPDRSEAIRLSAKIRRVEAASEDGEESGGIAVEFDGLYDDNRLAIDRFIKRKLLN